MTPLLLALGAFVAVGLIEDRPVLRNCLIGVIVILMTAMMWVRN